MRYKRIAECLYQSPDGIFHFKGQIDGHEFTRSLRTTDRAGAENQLVLLRDKLRQDMDHQRKLASGIHRGNHSQYVYLMRCGNMAKIGVSSDPIKRLKNLQTSCPAPVALAAFSRIKSVQMLPSDVEYLWHDRLSKYRRHGEWFELPLDVYLRVQAAIWRGDGPRLINLRT